MTALAIRKSSPMESGKIFTMDSTARRKPQLKTLCFAAEIVISAAAGGAWSCGQ
jgi:hypothetical protein